MSSSCSTETSQVSCSDCKLEIWEELLLKWLSKCVHPKLPVKKLNKHCFVEILKKYQHDISEKAVAKQLLNSGERVEKFICSIYPLLKFQNFIEPKKQYKKIYILTTVLLYHCCVNSKDGRVGHDICAHLNKREQETVLRFCEKLINMDITIGNIEAAIRHASVTNKSYKEKSYHNERNNPLIIYSEESNPMLDPFKIEKDTLQKRKDPPKTMIDTPKKIIDAPKRMIDPPKRMIEPPKRTNPKEDPSKREKLKSFTNTGVPSSVFYSDNVFLCRNRGIMSNKKCPLNQNMDTQFNLSSCSFVSVENVENCANDLTGSCCIEGCRCTKCSSKIPCCGDPGGSITNCYPGSKEKGIDNISHCSMKGCKCKKCCPKHQSQPTTCCGNTQSCLDHCDGKCKIQKHRKRILKKICLIILLLWLLFAVALIIIYSLMPELANEILRDINFNATLRTLPLSDRIYYPNVYQCKNSVCQKIYRPTMETIYVSLSRCILLCMKPQIWPYPTGFTYFSKNIVAISTSLMEYKIQSVPSESVYSYLAEAFKFFVKDLVKLEKIHVDNNFENHTKDIFIKKMSIQLDVETDADPRLRINTDETYNVKIELITGILTIKVTAASFCGARHGLETLSQLILLDQITGNLITLSNIIIRDAPSYKYRGLMIDTGRNYIPVSDLIRTIDAMATCKLNTFHWRITDVTSFPLYIPTLPQLFDNGAYDRESVYTRDDIKSIVKRAGIRGIRVLLEVAAPGPVGRAWSWSSDVSCPTKTSNFTCSNVLCLRLAMRETIMDILQILYTEIIDLTKVDDIFHLSDGVFSLVKCHYLIEEREGFLNKALERLKRANKGVLPQMPIIWYTNHLARDYEAQNWNRLGVQLSEWQPNPSDQFLIRFKVIHSSRWDLSCEIKKHRCRKYKTWQEMYSWRSWRNIEVFSIEGGEALLWTDMVDTGNIDYHLWPRAAAVAERLWSDIAINGTAAPSVYVRLNSHRWRMSLKGIKVQPIWPMYCTFNPDHCIQQIPGANK